MRQQLAQNRKPNILQNWDAYTYAYTKFIKLTHYNGGLTAKIETKHIFLWLNQY